MRRRLASKSPNAFDCFAKAILENALCQTFTHSCVNREKEDTINSSEQWRHLINSTNHLSCRTRERVRRAREVKVSKMPLETCSVPNHVWSADRNYNSISRNTVSPPAVQTDNGFSSMALWRACDWGLSVMWSSLYNTRPDNTCLELKLPALGR